MVAGREKKGIKNFLFTVKCARIAALSGLEVPDKRHIENITPAWEKQAFLKQVLFLP